MADNYWGASPELLTVSASPTPTASGFTVSSAANLLEATPDHPGQFILVKVSGVHERAQIATISGNAITLTAPLTGAPDSPGEVVNSRELIGKDSLNQGAVFNAADVADLKTVNTTQARSGLKYQIAGIGLYLLSKGSSATADDYTVIAPTTGGGRWLLQLGGNVWQTVTGSTALAPGGKYIANNSSRVPFVFPASPAVGSEFEVANRGTGGFGISLNSGQTVRYNATEYAFGQQLRNTDPYASVRLLCTAGNQFTVLNAQGSISFATVGAGYAMGGTNSGDQSSIYRLTYATEATDTPGATLDTARTRGGGGQSSTTGFYFGGLISGSTRSALIDDLNFSTQASAQIGNALATANFSFSVACSSTNAYRFCGSPVSGTSNEIWRFVFATTTDSLLGATMSNARDSSYGLSDTDNGYRVGGNAGTEIDKFNYAGESRSTISAVLPATRQNATTAQKAGSYGVVLGGDTGGGASGSILKLTFAATEVLSTLAATLNTARQNQAGCSSANKGFCLGGVSTSFVTPYDLIDDFDFTAETSSQLAATLAAARVGPVGVSALA